jgi:ATP-binding cassette subfamily B protein
MTTNPSQSALNSAQALENQLLFSSDDFSNLNPDLELLGFCMNKLGLRHKPLSSFPGADVIQLLDYNDIHHRQIDAPKDVATNHWDLDPTNDNEFPLMIVFDIDQQKPWVLYRQNGENYLYSAHIQKHVKAVDGPQLLNDAYEIYPSLPPLVNGPLSVIKFAFAADLWPIVALVLASAVVMIFNLSIPILTNKLVSQILPQNDEQLLVEGVVVVLLIVLGSIAASFLQNLMMLRLESVADLRLQSAVWDRLMRLPMSFITRYSTGDLASRVNSISQLRETLGSGTLTTLLSTLFSFTYFFLMFVYDRTLAFWALAFTLIAVISMLILTWRSIRLQMPLIESGAEITNFSLQSVMGLPQIRTAGAEPFLLLRWLREINRYALLQLRNNVYSDAISQYGVLVSPMASLFLFAVVAYRILNLKSSLDVTSTVVAFISFNAAFGSFNSAITNAVNMIANTAGRAAVYWRRAAPVMYADVEKGYQADALKHDLRGEFTISNISYEFPGAAVPLFNQLNFNVPPGKHTAITGSSGCGKTTLVRMLLGFITPQGGDILVDGIPLSQLSIRSYRRQLGVVMQTARLNAGSIYDVISGGVQYPEDLIWEALERAAIADEIRSMPMQLETLLSDSGSNVSGGQVQRLAIARALITNPKVLILDEATSALDNRSQQHITEVINNLGITRISIAHRLSTIKNADQIIVLEKGLPADSGSWHELKNRGYLKKMLQSH